MTIAKTGSSVSYAGNGSTTAFAFAFRFFADTDLNVYIVASDGTSTLQTLTTDYTVSNTGTESGGTVTMIVAPATGETLLIERDVPETQSVDYQNNDAFPAETHEEALDRLTLLVQQQTRGDDKRLTYPTGDTASPTLPTSTNRSSKLFGFDSSGGILMYDQTSGIYATYETRADFVTAVAGGLSVANGGIIAAAGLFYKAASGSTDISDLPGFVPANISDVRHFGATGDGVADDTAEIQAAIDYVNSQGGGLLIVPEGTFLVSLSASSSCVDLKSNVHIVGHGPSSIIKQANSSDAHVFANVSAASNFAVSNLKIDGNRANQTAQVHDIRLADATDVKLEDLIISEAPHYGIGIQDGTNTRITIVKVNIFNTGADGIDMKNRDDANSDIKIDNVSVRNWGLNTSGTSIQAAIDCRGHVLLSNIHISDTSVNDTLGIRFRDGELLDANGLGAHNSKLTNFYIDMGSTTSGIGVQSSAREVSISNGSVIGGFRGLIIQDSDNAVSDVMIDGVSDDGVILDALGSGLDADNTTLHAVTAKNCTDKGISIEADNCRLISCNSYNNDDGFVVESSANNTQIIGGYVNNNTTQDVGDSGADSKIRLVSGFVTDNRGTATLLNGNTSVTVTHGISITPSLGDILVTPHTSDGGASQFWISSVTSTTFDINMDADPGKNVSFSWACQVK